MVVEIHDHLEFVYVHIQLDRQLCLGIRLRAHFNWAVNFDTPFVKADGLHQCDVIICNYVRWAWGRD